MNLNNLDLDPLGVGFFGSIIQYWILVWKREMDSKIPKLTASSVSAGTLYRQPYDGLFYIIYTLFGFYF